MVILIKITERKVMIQALRIHMRRYVGVTTVIGGTLGLTMIPILLDKMILAEERATDEKTD